MTRWVVGVRIPLLVTNALVVERQTRDSQVSVAEWYTRKVQVLVLFGACEFDSHQRHKGRVVIKSDGVSTFCAIMSHGKVQTQ